MTTKIGIPLNPRNGDLELSRQIDFVKPALVVLDEGMMMLIGASSDQPVAMGELG